jgi:acetyl esterase/lipase
VSLEAATLGHVSVVTFTPPQPHPTGALLYLHGGSYIFGSARATHADLIARLALGTSRRVVAPEYRLAPEHPYPAALEDALAVFAALSTSVPADEIVLVGDSAGGNLALALQLALRDRGCAQARAAILISPWLELSAKKPSCRNNDRYDYGQTSFLLRHARDFAGALALDDPRISLLNAELASLNPVVVQVGGAERLYDEGVEFVDRARRAGVDATLDIAPEMPHLAPALADFHPAAKAALESVISHARRLAP